MPVTFSLPVNFLQNAGLSRVLYFLRSGDFLKIGITHDLVGRVHHFQLGNPHEITLDAYRTVPAALARQIEQQIHAALAQKAAGREWFTVSRDEALAVAAPIIQAAKAHMVRWRRERREQHGNCDRNPCARCAQDFATLDSAARSKG